MNRPQYILLSLSIFLSVSLFAQEQEDYSFEGMWRGLLSQSDKSLMYDVVLKVYYETDTTLFGTAKIVSRTGSFAEFYVEGTHDSNHIAFEDITLMKEHGGTVGSPWCIKEYLAKVYIENDKWVMSGTWENHNSAMITNKVFSGKEYCKPGKFHLTKVKGYANQSMKSDDKVRYFQGRLVDVQKTFEVETDSVTLFVIDNNQLDNDTVTIFYDKTLMVKQHGLTYEPLEIVIPVPEGREHLMVIYANNVGSIPPNTAAIYFYEYGVRKEVAIRSDTSNNAGILFKRKKSQSSD